MNKSENQKRLEEKNLIGEYFKAQQEYLKHYEYFIMLTQEAIKRTKQSGNTEEMKKLNIDFEKAINVLMLNPLIEN